METTTPHNQPNTHSFLESRPSSSNKVIIFDTTLRDGQQCPGAGLTFSENIEYAHRASTLGVDVLEAGFPSASGTDYQIVNVIANELASVEDSPIIAALCQLRAEQVEQTLEALAPAIKVGKARMHVYLPVDPALMTASLGGRAAEKQALIKELYTAVSMATALGVEVEFSPEGYSRVGPNFDFCTDLFRACIEAGARIFNCPDTIGGAARYQRDGYFVELMNRHAACLANEFPNIPLIWSTHCHNDLGLALENTLNSVFDGPARQVEGCFNGIGERAGNVALEQVVMIMKLWGNVIDPDNPFYTSIDPAQLESHCAFVAQHMLPMQPHWPIVGSNAARHSSGGHTNAILKNPMIYQPYDPAMVGKSISLTFGPLSGSNHARDILAQNGIELPQAEKTSFTQFVKDRTAHRRKGITDEEVVALYSKYCDLKNSGNLTK